MQYVENDMDDLFKRAAEHYPLRAGESNWEAVAERLRAEQERAAVPAGPPTGRRQYLLGILLVSILSIGSVLFIHDSAPFRQVVPTSARLKEIPVQIPGDRRPPQSRARMQPAIATRAVTGLLKRNSGGSWETHAMPSGKRKEEPYDNIRLAEISELPAFEPVTKTDAQQLKIIVARANMETSRVSATMQFVIPVGPAAHAGLAAATRDAKLSINKKEQIQSRPPAGARAYVGFVAGPDLSKVRSMAFSKTGVYLGMVAGIPMAKRLTLETGLIWSKKYYDSRGADFSMDKIGASMGAGMVINDLSGEGSLVELPLKLKYEAWQFTRGAVYFAGGLSAYIMTHEKNFYRVTMNGSNDRMTGIYGKANWRLPAVASVHAGFQHDISKTLQLRIEPSLKIPLMGVGIGSVSIFSAGMQIGVIRRFP